MESDQVTSKYQTDFLNKTYKKKVQNKKSEHHHRILHIRNSLGTKFQLKLTILNFLDQINPKRVLESKIKKIKK